MGIYNLDCVSGSKQYLADKSQDLLICDPPFGIGEKSFDKHYNRKENFVTEGYVEAPKDYYTFSKQWITEAKRVLKPNGSMYIISGWTNSDIIARVLRELDFVIVNKLIWQYNFGVYTSQKFVTSHYEIFYVKLSKKAKPTFNLDCRYSADARTTKGKKAQYEDRESVWKINREYQQGKEKNKNKLPEALIKKMIQYSSNEGDRVCDFFLGNFTTAIVAKKMNRVPVGFELNDVGFDKKVAKLNAIASGCDLKDNIEDDIFAGDENERGNVISIK